MGKEQYKPSKIELLLELESIKTTLNNAIESTTTMPSKHHTAPAANTAEPTEAIPKLTDRGELSETTDSNQAGTYTQENQLANAQADTEQTDEAANANLPNTDTSASNTNYAAPEEVLNNDKPAKEKPDNPFLPPHIRERLNTIKQHALVEELNILGEALERSRQQIPRASEQANQSVETTFDYQQAAKDVEEIVENLVKEYLPLLEKKLKQRLKAKLGQHTDFQGKPQINAS